MKIPVVIATFVAVLIIMLGGFYLTRFLISLEPPLLPEDVPGESAVLITPLPSEPASISVPVASKPVPQAVGPVLGQSGEEPSPPIKEIKMILTFKEKTEALKQSIAGVCDTGQTQEVKLTISESEANEQVEKLLASTKIKTDLPLEVTGVRIFFEDDNLVKAEIKAIVYSLKSIIKAETVVSILGGEPEIEITRLSFGFLPLPNTFRDKVHQLLRQNIDEAKAAFITGQMSCEGRIELKFTRIDIRQGEAAVTMSIRRK